MPRSVRPNLPDDFERAIDVIGSKVRAAALRSLMLDGPASQKDLAARIGVSDSLLRVHMGKLEDDGIVFTDPPRSETGYRSRLYRIDVEDFQRLLQALNDGFVSLTE